MYPNLKNAPYIFARNVSGRMVQIAGSAGDVGKIANFVVPPEREIKRLRPFIRYMERLRPRAFSYGLGNSYGKYRAQPRRKLVENRYNETHDLPLFKRP